jgi:hypothetical protein
MKSLITLQIHSEAFSIKKEENINNASETKKKHTPL